MFLDDVNIGGQLKIGTELVLLLVKVVQLNKVQKSMVPCIARTKLCLVVN